MILNQEVIKDQARKAFEISKAIFEVAEHTPVAASIRKRGKMTSEKIVESLSAMGIATNLQIRDLNLTLSSLRKEIWDLKKEIESLKNSGIKSSAFKTKE